MTIFYTWFHLDRPGLDAARHRGVVGPVFATRAARDAALAVARLDRPYGLVPATTDAAELASYGVRVEAT